MGSTQLFLSFLSFGLLYLLTGIGQSNSLHLEENTSYQTCRERDSLALVALYNSTDGANWINTWDLSQSMDDWYGVTLNSNGCVSCLDFDGIPDCSPNQFGTSGGNRLKGFIPKEIGELNELWYLSFHENQLMGFIPTEISQLENLTNLILSDNQLEGTIPAEIGNLDNLWRLFLWGNQLTGSIPEELGNLNNITRFGLSNNQLSGTIPNSIGNLTNLVVLDFSNNQIVGVIPKELGNLTSLETLNLYNNQLSSEIPSELSKLINLGRFWLYNNELSGCYPNELSIHCDIDFNLTGNLSLPWQGDFSRFCNGEIQIGASCDDGDGDANRINDVIQEDCECRGITTSCNRQADSLELIKFYNHFNGANWVYNNTEEYWNYRGGQVEIVPNAGNAWLEGSINQWHGVELTSDGCIDRLILSNMNITGTFIQFDLPELDGIYLENNNITGGLIDFNLPQLTKLFINSNPIGGNLVDFKNMPNLISFLANGCEFEGELIDFTGIPQLTELQLGGNFLTGDIPDFRNIPELVQLHLSGSNKFNYLPNFSNLEALLTLGLVECGVKNLPDFSNCPNLYGLYLAHCSIEHEIPDFTDNCPNLRALWLNQNQLTFEDILPTILENNNLITTNKMEAIGLEDSLVYAPQDKIFKDTIIQVSENSDLSIDLEIDEGIQTNVYQWFKNNEAVQTIIGNNNLTFQNIQIEDDGVYTVEVTNSQAPNLILRSHNITINIVPLVDDLSYNVTVNTTCPEEQEGSFELILNGGVPPYQLRWSSIDNNQTGEEILGEGENLFIENLATGLYNVFISDDLSINPTIIDVLIGEKTEGCKEKGIAPQVITPNGDGLNETFEFDELNDNPQNYPDNELIIVNRWGDVILLYIS